MTKGEPRQIRIFGVHEIKQLLHICRRISPEMHTGLSL
jgi:hypothetical protein